MSLRIFPSLHGSRLRFFIAGQIQHRTVHSFLYTPAQVCAPCRLEGENPGFEIVQESVKVCTTGMSSRTLYAQHPVSFFSFFFFHLTYSRWTSSLPSCLWSQRIFPSLPGSRLTIFLSRCKFSTLTTRQPMVEFYLLTFPRFPLRKKEHKSYFGKNRTHDFRTSRCAAYLLDHSLRIFPSLPGSRLRFFIAGQIQHRTVHSFLYTPAQVDAPCCRLEAHYTRNKNK